MSPSPPPPPPPPLPQRVHSPTSPLYLTGHHEGRIAELVLCVDVEAPLERVLQPLNPGVADLAEHRLHVGRAVPSDRVRALFVLDGGLMYRGAAGGGGVRPVCRGRVFVSSCFVVYE